MPKFVTPEFTLHATSDEFIWREQNPQYADGKEHANYRLDWQDDTHRFHTWLNGRALPGNYHRNDNKPANPRLSTHKLLSFDTIKARKLREAAGAFLADPAIFEAAKQVAREEKIARDAADLAKRAAKIREQIAALVIARLTYPGDPATDVLHEANALSDADLVEFAGAFR